MTSICDQLREQTVDTVLGRIRLQVGGSGAPIVFWPSLLMTGDMWHGVADELIARHQVVLVDPQLAGSSCLIAPAGSASGGLAAAATSAGVSGSEVGIETVWVDPSAK